MTNRTLQPEVHDDGTVTVTAAIRIRVPDAVALRARVAAPHVNEDGEMFLGDDGETTAIARAVSIVIDAAPFAALGIELVNNAVSAPGATAFHPHLE